MNMKLLLPLLLLGSIAITGLAVAQPPPGEPGMHGPGHGPMMMAGFDQIGLTDAQKASIKQIMESHRDEMRAMHQSERTQRKSFEALDPNSAAYATQVNTLAQQAASLASQRVQQMAAVKTQVYGLLTSQQKTQLANIIANLPDPQEAAPPQE